MSVLRVNNISNQNDNGAPQLTYGATVGAGQTINGNISLTGVATATSFVGNGSGISSFIPNEIRNSRVIALTITTL